MKLVLFDIDGTLLNTGASGVKTINEVIYKKYGKKPNYDVQEIVGQTDKHNFDLIYKSVFNKKPTPKVVNEILKDYLAALPGEIQHQIKNKKYRTLSGIENFLKELSKQKGIVFKMKRSESSKAS